MAEFFADGRETIFDPLVGKHRELYARAIGELHDRMNTPVGSSVRAVTSEIARTWLAQALPAWRAYSDDAGPDAGALLRAVIEHGWLDVYVDAATAHRALRFTRVGKVFAAAMLSARRATFQVRQRNLRLCRNALRACVEDSPCDYNELLQAYLGAQSVAQDLQDVIDELIETQRALLTPGQSGEDTSEQFARFLAAFRNNWRRHFSVDSIYRYMDDVFDLCDRLETLPESVHLTLDREINEFSRQVVEAKHAAGVHTSTSIWLIDGVRAAIRAAVERRPLLDATLRDVVGRMQDITERVSMLTTGQLGVELTRASETAAGLRGARQGAWLEHLGSLVATVRIRMLDPGRLSLPQARVREAASTRSRLPVLDEASIEAQRNAYISLQLARAVSLRGQEALDSIVSRCEGAGEYRLSSAPIEGGRDVLLAARAVLYGNTSAGRDAVEVQMLDSEFDNGYVRARDAVVRKKR